MGQLGGFRYRDIVKRLKQLRLEFHRQAAGSHEIWHNPATNRYTTIPNHPATCPKVRFAPFLSRPASRPMCS
jgi:predicted RNA binding protein YcfA (HicA-like mRNA interferase family)